MYEDAISIKARTSGMGDPNTKTREKAIAFPGLK
jgi:hypothetical protein